jgi:hypothetical protein
MQDQYSKPMESALGSGYFVKMQLPEGTTEKCLLARYI